MERRATGSARPRGSARAQQAWRNPSAQGLHRSRLGQRRRWAPSSCSSRSGRWVAPHSREPQPPALMGAGAGRASAWGTPAQVFLGARPGGPQRLRASLQALGEHFKRFTPLLKGTLAQAPAGCLPQLSPRPSVPSPGGQSPMLHAGRALPTFVLRAFHMEAAPHLRPVQAPCRGHFRSTPALRVGAVFLPSRGDPGSGRRRGSRQLRSSASQAPALGFCRLHHTPGTEAPARRRQGRVECPLVTFGPQPLPRPLPNSKMAPTT